MLVLPFFERGFSFGCQIKWPKIRVILGQKMANVFANKYKLQDQWLKKQWIFPLLDIRKFEMSWNITKIKIAHFWSKIVYCALVAIYLMTQPPAYSNLFASSKWPSLFKSSHIYSIQDETFFLTLLFSDAWKFLFIVTFFWWVFSWKKIVFVRLRKFLI